jgi:hypothetical protein
MLNMLKPNIKYDGCIGYGFRIFTGIMNLATIYALPDLAKGAEDMYIMFYTPG